MPKSNLNSQPYRYQQKKYKNIFNKAFVPSNKHLAQLQQENLISTKAHAQNS
jgi:hypothetical protein